MENNTIQLTNGDKGNKNESRKKIALAAMQMEENFLQNMHQANTFAMMAFLESSSDEDNDDAEDVLLRVMKTLANN